MKGIKGLWRLRHLGKSPMRILRGNTYAGVFGIGDNGLEAVNRLIKRGVEDVNYLVQGYWEEEFASGVHVSMAVR